jgi:uncharacterized alkaline shock family protein YloU
VQDNNDQRTGDLPVASLKTEDESKPSLSHDVIATYVADAARSVVGIVALHVSTWKGLSSRMREIHSGGVIIRDSESGPADVEIHVRVAWGVQIPELAAEVEAAVRERVAALLNIDLGTITLYVDDITGPMEADITREG